MTFETIVVGTRIRFAEERTAYTVQAENDRYLICTKKMFGRTIYTIVDLVEKVRGPDDRLFGQSYATRPDCEERLIDLMGRLPSMCISHRNRVPLVIVDGK